MYYYQPWAIDRVRRANNYATVDALSATECRLPMESGEPSSVFADEEIGVVAAKVGDTRLYANMFYCTPTINDMARVHLTTPKMDRFGTVAMKSVFNASVSI